MASLRARSLAFTGLVFFLCCSAARSEEVPIKWKIPGYPLEPLNRWILKLRFAINDSLVFRYDGQRDSVLEVTKQDFRACDASNPISVHRGGLTKVPLPESGSYRFISGAPGHCERGQKLLVIARERVSNVDAEETLSPARSPNGDGDSTPSPAPHSPEDYSNAPDLQTSPNDDEDAPSQARSSKASDGHDNIPSPAPSPEDDNDNDPSPAPSPEDDDGNTLSPAPSPNDDNDNTPSPEPSSDDEDENSHGVARSLSKGAKASNDGDIFSDYMYY